MSKSVDRDLVQDLGRSIQDLIVAMQAAYIEWQHGAGADAGMRWIANTLFGPGFIPDSDAPYGREAQAWYDANRSNPFPQCQCGRPSNIAWMGHGFCCQEHYRAHRNAAQGGGAEAALDADERARASAPLTNAHEAKP